MKEKIAKRCVDLILSNSKSRLTWLIRGTTLIRSKERIHSIELDSFIFDGSPRFG